MMVKFSILHKHVTDASNSKISKNEVGQLSYLVKLNKLQNKGQSTTAIT